MYESGVKEKDFHNLGNHRALEIALKYTKWENIKDNKDFWRYLEIGGIQGAIYFIDSYIK